MSNQHIYKIPSPCTLIIVGALKVSSRYDPNPKKDDPNP